MNRLEKAYGFVHDEKYLSVSRVHLSDTRLWEIYVIPK